MEQKFINFEEALEKLNISAERLHALREEGQLRAYRDGKSWKFRTDEIQNMVESGVPEPPPPSDIGLVAHDDLVAAAPIELPKDEEELELTLADDEGDKSDLDLELSLDETDAISGGSELEPSGLDDTVTTEGGDFALDEEPAPPSASDSILLSEEALGESVSGSPSTIIGKDKAEGSDLDLELALDDDDASDVNLSSAAGASDVLSSGAASSGVLDEHKSSGGTSAFKDLDELEIDLAAESSPVLSPEETIKAKGVLPSDAPAANQESDLELELDDSAISLDDSGDLITDDGSGGSDLTLESSDSGINLIAPSDSGLALDDIPLEMGGSAILSSLSLEGSDPEISLIGDDAASGAPSGTDVGDEPFAELQTDDDFQLTPLREGGDGEDDSSSQVIALDGDLEDFGDSAAVLEEDDFAAEAEDVLAVDFAEAPAGDLAVGYAPMAAPAEAPYSWGNLLSLGSITLLLFLGGIMMFDMMNHIWSWDEPYTLSSPLIEAVLGLFGK
jgi:hypothetical protein